MSTLCIGVKCSYPTIDLFLEESDAIGYYLLGWLKVGSINLIIKYFWGRLMKSLVSSLRNEGTEAVCFLVLIVKAHPICLAKAAVV